MKRRVAGLPPVTAIVFHQKVLDKRVETAVTGAGRGASCEVCGKSYTTENAYRSHLSSKKHKIQVFKVEAQPKQASEPFPHKPEGTVPEKSEEPTSTKKPEHNGSTEPLQNYSNELSLGIAEDDEDDEITQSIVAKIASARFPLTSTHCLFCTQEFQSLDSNLTHMSQVHSFFVPDADYLVDLPGLITYLGEKIAVGNICIYCNEKGREFRTLEAVRKHMVDKSHCKIGYDTLNDRIEISDFFDFTASYTNVFPRPRRKNENALAVSTEQSMEEGVWEDISGSDDSDVDEVIEIEPDGTSEEDKSDEDDREIPPSQVTYGDSPFELVLPSGKRLGHRSLRRYYAQSFPTVPRGGNQEDPTSGAALVRRLLADKNSALVPRKGGFGAFGSGTDIIKARNHGEAREAGRHIREHRDQRRREEFKTKIGFIHNSQKHYRDPLLQ